VQQLGVKFGPAGPLCVTHMLGVTKLQSLTGDIPEGHVRLGYGALAHAAFLPEWKLAAAIVQEACRLQIVELIEDTPDDFEVRFLRWNEYQRDITGAERKRRERARKKAQQAEKSNDCHATVRDMSVTVAPYIDKDNDKSQKQEEQPWPDDADSVRPVSETDEPELADEATAKAEELCVTLADLIEENGSKRPTITKSWRDEARRLLVTDNRDPLEAERVMRWCQADNFWQSNILSMVKFRKQYDRLRLRMLNDSKPRPAGDVDSYVDELRAHAEDLRRQGR
jgi:hypothetical protein